LLPTAIPRRCRTCSFRCQSGECMISMSILFLLNAQVLYIDRDSAALPVLASPWVTERRHLTAETQGARGRWGRLGGWGIFRRTRGHRGQPRRDAAAAVSKVNVKNSARPQGLLGIGARGAFWAASSIRPAGRPRLQFPRCRSGALSYVSRVEPTALSTLSVGVGWLCQCWSCVNRAIVARAEPAIFLGLFI
jgi:hypothetical protein